MSLKQKYYTGAIHNHSHHLQSQTITQLLIHSPVILYQKNEEAISTKLTNFSLIIHVASYVAIKQTENMNKRTDYFFSGKKNHSKRWDFFWILLDFYSRVTYGKLRWFSSSFISFHSLKLTATIKLFNYSVRYVCCFSLTLHLYV